MSKKIRVCDRSKGEILTEPAEQRNIKQEKSISKNKRENRNENSTATRCITNDERKQVHSSIVLVRDNIM